MRLSLVGTMFAIRRPRLYIVECIPKTDSYEEGAILFRFLEMAAPKRIGMRSISNKKDLVRLLADTDRLERYNFVHMSGHGEPKMPAFELPRGYVSPEEFPEGCFSGKTVTFSACGLSSREFVDPFIDMTGSKAVIAPRKDVKFEDAAIWYLTFYYLVLHHRFPSVRAFDRVNDMLCYGPRRGRVKGGFEYWR